METVSPGEANETQRAIVGGANTGSEFPAVVSLNLADRGLCTGTVIGPRIVLTAAHCVDFIIGTDLVDDVIVGFGADARAPSRTIASVDVRSHRNYDPGNFTGFDIALIHLAEDAGVDPVPLNTMDLSEVASTDDDILAVGYGISNPEVGSGAGTRRSVDIPLAGIAAGHIIIGNSMVNICQGDSGGPHLLDIEGEKRIVAVSSFGDAGCRGNSQHTRVDAHLETFLFPVIDRWEGACTLDGACETQGCRTPDPDCDPCGFNDTCAEDCPEVDLDCPLGTRFQGACTSDTDCESRICLPRGADDDTKFCTRTCDPDQPASCSLGFECRTEPGVAAGEPICHAFMFEADDDGGCGCRVAPRRVVPTPWWLLPAALLAVTFRRRA